jgi:Heparinase II/III-like protein/Heparinase II/III N-terminus
VIRRLAARLARMDSKEVGWRGRTAARIAFDRARAALVAPKWNRADLTGGLRHGDDLHAARAALYAGAWDDAHAALARHFVEAPRYFAISPGSREHVVGIIRAAFPDSVCDAVERADRVVAGEYDLLGYRGLRFGAGLPDWQLDPVHGRRPPRLFWGKVPYLAAECGDHKIIWELNRHQHWLALGRAFWLTGDEKYRDRFVAELEDWIATNPPLTGINWASMLELGLRSISWLWAIQFFARPPRAAGRSDCQPWLVDLLLALDRQLTQIERNLSYYFSPNTHLLGEALALYAAGRALPELRASRRREAAGRTILLAEIDRQIAADGGHCERSTHYHRYALDFYAFALSIAQVTGDDAAAARFEDAVSRLAVAARLLADGRGIVPHIGDDDGGALLPLAGRAPDDFRGSLAVASALVRRPELQIGETPEEVVWMLGELPPAAGEPNAPVPSAALSETGYYVSRSIAGDHMVIDGGPHGYQNGGHAHADALSLTLSVGGAPLLIDPGTGCYTIDAVLRDRLRSTASHNSLTLDDRSQSLPNGPFHWAQVAKTQVHRWRTNPRFDFFDGSHDGYGALQHRRRVFALHGDLVVVADLASGPGSHRADVHWHLDPSWSVALRGRRAELVGGDGAARAGLVVPQGVLERFSADATTGLGWHSPVYGRVEPTTTLRVSHEGSGPFWIVSVFDLDPRNPVSDVVWVPVWAEAGTLAHAVALRITRDYSIDHVLVAEPASDGNRLWRVGEIETDARLLFFRSVLDCSLSCAGLVDGSVLRVQGRRDLQLALAAVAADYFVDFGIRNQSLCAASPVS